MVTNRSCGSYFQLVQCATTFRCGVRAHALCTLAVSAVVALTGLVPAEAQASATETRIFNGSGKLVGVYDFAAVYVGCENIDIWATRRSNGRVTVYATSEGTYNLTYARRVSPGYWRIAEIFVGYPHLGTIRRVGNRWVLRNKKGRVLGFTRGPEAVEAALAYATFGESCIVR